MASKDFLYPDITPQTLRLIEVMRMTYADHPDYFEHGPYPYEVEQYFRGWFQTPVSGEAPSQGSGSALEGEDRYEALYIETVHLYRDLKAAKPVNTDASEAMAYFRTAASLADKLLSYQERSLGIRQLHQFHQVVMDIMEAVLNEDQRAEAMQRMKDAIQSN